MYSSDNKKTYLFWLLACVAFIFLTSGSFAADHVQKYADRNDVSTYYEVYGQGATAILFIHGWACDRAVWRFQVPALEDTFRVIVLDLPGHGKSDAPRIVYNLDVFARAVKDVLDNEGLQDAVLVGHSMGFAVARHFIKQYPNRVKALINIDGAYFQTPQNPGELKMWTHQMNAFTAGFQKQGEARREYISGFVESLFVDNSQKDLKQEITNKILMTPAYVANSAMEEFVRPEIWRKYSLSTPTLAVYAESDDLPQDNQEYLRSLFPNLEYHQWKNVGHFLMMEKPDKLNKLMRDYLTRNIGD